MPSAFVSLIVGFLASLLIVLLNRSRTGAGIDDASIHRRKLHGGPVPRTGGVAILAALLCGLGALPWDAAREALVLVACAAPCVAGGLADDLSDGAPPRVRLALMTVSALLVWWLAGVRITRAELAPLDALLAEPAVCAAVTVLALLTVTNGVNLIDGLNGLAGATCLMIFGALALAGAAEGDTTVAGIALLTCGAVAGFMAWNFPRGRLFLGDGGAYLLGFTAGALAILLVARNAAVSPWFIPVLLAYPLTEVGFSVWRRRTHRRRGIVTADAAHLHHLVYRRVIRLNGPDMRERRNALASLLLWGPCLLAVAPAVALRADGPALGALLLLFVAGYVGLYLRITRLRVPRWLLVRPGRGRP